jgi:hypothetical protein
MLYNFLIGPLAPLFNHHNIGCAGITQPVLALIRIAGDWNIANPACIGLTVSATV